MEYYIFPQHQTDRAFVGRDDILLRIENKFASDEPTTVLLHGLGGIGKTQVALEYCRRAKTSKKFCAILWVNAASLLELNKSIKSITEVVPTILPENSGLLSDSTLISLFWDWLRKLSKPVLLVLDNCDDMYIFEQLWPFLKPHFILVTSRRKRNWLSQEIEIPSLCTEEAVGLLLKSCRYHRSEISDGEMDEAKYIVDELGGLPIALAHVGAYIRHSRLRLDQFVSLYQRQGHKFLKQAKHDNTSYSHSLSRIFEMSFEILSGKAMALLNTLAFFNPGEISELFFRNYYEIIHNLDWNANLSGVVKEDFLDTTELMDVLIEIWNHSLIQLEQFGEEYRRISLHPLTVKVILERLTQKSIICTLSLLQILLRLGFKEYKPRLGLTSWMFEESLHTL